MNIAFYEIEDWQQAYVSNYFPGHNLNFFQSILNRQNLPATDTEILSVFVNSKIDAEVLKLLPKLKFIATRSTGFDHIDIQAASAAHILVSNVPAYGENTVAEFTFALILALSRKLYPAIKRVREEGLFTYNNLRGFDLKGKTLGVVGTGRIGARVIKIAKGFEMEVIAYDPRENKDLANELGFVYVPLNELMSKADVITLHVPYMPATHHLINEENLKVVKPGAIIINTARGAIIDTQSLLRALTDKRLAGAGLDVLEEEGYIIDELNLLTGHPHHQELKTVLADHELMQMDNVIVTPHNAFNTQEAMQRILETSLENIRGFLNNTPINLAKIS